MIKPSRKQLSAVTNFFHILDFPKNFPEPEFIAEFSLEANYEAASVPPPTS